MNSNNTEKFFQNIKPIINGYYYERRMAKKEQRLSGGFSGNRFNNVVHLDNGSMLKSSIISIMIESK